MKTKSVLILIFMIYPVIVFCQNSIEGTYYSYGAHTLEIKKDSFRLAIPNRSLSGGYLDSMIVNGIIEQLSPDLLELNSVERNIHEYLRVVQSTKGNLKDSIRIRFHIPSQKKLIIYLPIKHHIDGGNVVTEDVFLHYKKNKSEEIILPWKDRSLVDFYIRQENIEPHDGFRGVFYGTLEQILMNVEDIENVTNNIDIYIPDIDDMYFFRYRVINEYAKLSGDTISWKREKYIKNKTTWFDWVED